MLITTSVYDISIENDAWNDVCYLIRVGVFHWIESFFKLFQKKYLNKKIK